jgi:orotate phosphoribosyltransferase
MRLDDSLGSAQLAAMKSNRQLVQLLAERSTRRGQFTLASGQKSDYYIDARLTTMSPEGLATIGPLALDRLRQAQWEIDAVGGLTLGADPVSYAISYASSATSQPLRAFTVRKQAKTHGTQKLVEGPMRTGDRVVIIEDVITTGGSALQAVQAVQAAGALVVGVLGLVDREQGGRLALEQEHLQVLTLTTASEILAFLDSQSHTHRS